NHVGDQAARQAVPGAEVSKPVAVEKRDSFHRAKPEIPFGIPVNPGHPIPNQAILSAKNAEGGLLRKKRVSGRQREEEQSKMSSHEPRAQASAGSRIQQAAHRILMRGRAKFHLAPRSKPSCRAFHTASEREWTCNRS